MLDTLFLQILNMSFTASIVIVFVLFVRLLLKKVPKVFSYGLWSIVLFRLICPFSFESIFSFLPTKANPIPNDIMYSQVPQINTGIQIINNSVNRILPAAIPEASINPIQVKTLLAAGQISTMTVLGQMKLLVVIFVIMLKVWRNYKH